jgi:hypothetical protein
MVGKRKSTTEVQKIKREGKREENGGQAALKKINEYNDHF